MTIERHVRHFQDELETLKARLLQMGGYAEERLQSAVKGLVDRDPSVIERVLTGDQVINQLHIEIDDRAFKLLALHQPVASDLRTIVAAVKINTDLERVGDHPPVKELIDIPKMATIAQTMLRDALDAYVRPDTELAQQVLDRDDELDQLKTRVFRDLLGHMLSDQSTVEGSLDLILISRHLERVGDHATNIAEDAIFMVSARDVRHHAND